MKANRKQRRAERKRRQKTAGPTPPKPEKMNPQARAEALTIGLGQICDRYAAGDHDMAAMALTSAAAIRSIAAGDEEDVFVARARTLYQQARQAIADQQGSIITNPAAGRIVGPDGTPA